MGKFPFSDDVVASARARQSNRCARCGKALMTEKEIEKDDKNYALPPLRFASHAHHVFPQQAGSIDNPDHGWIAGVENCVVIHTDEHFAVHGFNWGTGGVAPPEEFPFSHNILRVQHAEWVRNLKRKCDPIWEQLRRRYEDELKKHHGVEKEAKALKAKRR
jgi:hypothetical protein